jgi:hypothetical protein
MVDIGHPAHAQFFLNAIAEHGRTDQARRGRAGLCAEPGKFAAS